jgi:hypothetical protein
MTDRSLLIRKIKKLLMLPGNITSALWERAQGQGSRSTVLRPLGWLLALCASGSLTSASIPTSPLWLTALFGIGTGLSVVTYLVAFGYCLLKAPESLRTERYSIQKLAIEKGFRGDSSTGVVVVSREDQNTRLLQNAEDGAGGE